MSMQNFLSTPLFSVYFTFGEPKPKSLGYPFTESLDYDSFKNVP